MSGCMGTLRMRGLRGRDQPAHLDHRGGPFLRGIARPGRPLLLQRQLRLGMGGDGILCQRLAEGRRVHLRLRKLGSIERENRLGRRAAQCCGMLPLLQETAMRPAYSGIG